VTGGAGYRHRRGAAAPMNGGVARAGGRYNGWAASVVSSGGTKLAARGPGQAARVEQLVRRRARWCTASVSALSTPSPLKPGPCSSDDMTSFLDSTSSIPSLTGR
jgi:hypothetical protein